MTDTQNAQPTGKCYCGCGRSVGYGRFFAPGHDKMAEAAFLAIHHGGSVAQMIHSFNYGPDDAFSVTKIAVRKGVWQKCPRTDCDYRGSQESINNHVDRYHIAKETAEKMAAEATAKVQKAVEGP